MPPRNTVPVGRSSTGPDSEPNLGVVLERIGDLRGDVSEIKAQITCYNDREIAFEMKYTEERTSLAADVRTAGETAARAHKRIDDLEKQVVTIGDAVKPLIFQSKVLAWASSLIGGALILGALSFLWAIATHQIVITTVVAP